MMRKVISLLLIIAFFAGCSKEPFIPAIGKKYRGGVIFYVDGSGNHGLIAAEEDQSAGIRWHNGVDTVRTYAWGVALGTGEMNTSAIVNLLGAGNYAARLCFDATIDDYSDWYLPSSDELNLLYLQKDEVGGFSNTYYWNSTDLNGSPQAIYAGNQHFGTGERGMNANMHKSSLNAVRAIRRF
jgi:hypothetical protein